MGGFKSYLTDIKNFKHRLSRTELRLSNNGLVIGTGRYKQQKQRKNYVFALYATAV